MWLLLLVADFDVALRAEAAAAAQCVLSAQGARKEACAKALASMGDVPRPPGLAIEDADRWVAATGGLRIFSSLVGPRRLRVGVTDPDGIVDRLEVRWRAQTGAAGLLLVERRGDRIEVEIPEVAGEGEIAAVTERFGDPITLQLAPLTLDDDAPPPPPRAKTAEVEAVEEGGGLSTGWWIAALVVGVALAGAGIVEELR